MKTKLSSLDRENFKFEKIIYDIDYINNKKGPKTHYNWNPEVYLLRKKRVYLEIMQVSNPSLINLRRQLKENQTILSLKEKEVDRLKKASKLTRITELEVDFFL